MNLRWTAAAAAILAGAASADGPVAMQEKATPGLQRHHKVVLAVNGKMTTDKGEKPLAGQAALQYPERVLEVDEQGVPKKVLRYYAGARAKFMVAGEDIEHSLRPVVRTIVAERQESGCSLWSPGGPFTSDELEVVEDLLDVTRIPGLLANKSVNPGDGWNVDPKVAQALCNLDSLIGAELIGTFKELKDGKAIVAVKGDVHGMQHGGEAKIKVEATVVYNVADAMVEALDWTQTDARAASPISPAGNYKVRIEVKRDKSESPNLSDRAIAGVNVVAKQEHKLLILEGPNKRYRFLHERDWHVTAARNNVIVMRCVRDNEFLGQLSIAMLNEKTPGAVVKPDELQQIVEATNGVKIEEIERTDDLKNGAGVTIQKIVAKGATANGKLKLAHRHYLATGPGGSQVLFSFLLEPANEKKLGAADESIVQSLEVIPQQAAALPPPTSGR